MTTTVLDRFRLDGKVAIVTGASSGLGIAFAEALAEAGPDLVLTARRSDRLTQTRALVEERGRRAPNGTAHIPRPEDAQTVVDAALTEFGHIDVLVNNAGKGTAVPATRETPEQFREVIDINLNGSYWMGQAWGRVMQPGSSIINVASVVALTSGKLPQAAYSASKAGVTGLTRDLAVQWTGRKGPFSSPTVTSTANCRACPRGGRGIRRSLPPRWCSSPAPPRPTSPVRR